MRKFTMVDKASGEEFEADADTVERAGSGRPQQFYQGPLSGHSSRSLSAKTDGF